MSALGGLIGAASRQRSSSRRVAAWALAVVAPTLIGLVSVPFRSSFGLAGGLFCMMLVVVAVAVAGGMRPALVAVGASLLAGAFFLAPPYNDPGVSRLGDGLALVAFALVGTAVAILVDELAQVGEQQATSRRVEAALRRVATLVAVGPPAAELYAAVTEEVGQLLPVDFAIMGRYESDGTVTCVANWGAPVDRFPVGSRSRLEGRNLVTIVLETGRPARVDGFEHASGRLGVAGHDSGYRSTIGTPIVVEGRLWGVMTVGSIREEPPLPSGTEARLAQFTELLATAVANAESRSRLARLAEEQAALRRVATLVGRGAAPKDVFGAVTGEIGQLLPVDSAAMGRYEADGTLAFVASWGQAIDFVPVGSRWRVGGKNLGTIVFETGRAARIDSYADASGLVGVAARDRGVRSSVATPIIVEGRLWGVMGAGSSGEQSLPADTEARLASFTELLATAIANAESRAEIAGSRARIVAAADDTRRRIERDLHDGAQQRLVSLGLELRVAQAQVPPGLGGLEGELSRVAEGLASVQEELREFARGIHPANLAEGGLGPALRTLARRSAVPVDLEVRAEGRMAEQLEVAAYYVVSEALTNAAKHAHASLVHVEVQTVDGVLRLGVSDDGTGGADPTRGSGLVGLKDRIEALGGTITVHSPLGAGTCVGVELPLDS
ncbi:MAG TPA: GAF domain-containing protein [Solirubrobacteraceae bacterium]|nr:GAF domain-containing protein [Solirubrobacteraceae bacterium]